ncbi:PREDICTED: uncharacterized protein LOC109590504 [Amphimedon queenslandica]|uniref:Uncharacterized protein n=1 Tax=Amphimedon queenslandica TaxID=400682 RepID=A0A1X7VMW6_AMPQE|nr:PREDICTED: uncharacterized protein LOC109590504 [Amphimedon queenslandica]|eukprot:XP_019861968.1 PREDICTED: uncharacterized protein LOC109590504 [Amphimedon queenslandica]
MVAPVGSSIGRRSTAVSLNRRKRRTFSNITAQWFTVPQFITKLLELTLSSISIILIFTWESEGIRVTTIRQDDYNYRNYFFYYICVLSTSVLYSVILMILGWTGVRLPSKAVTLLAGGGVLLWLFANPLMSGTIKILDNSVYARQNNLNTLQLKATSVLGFFLLATFIFDILLGFIGLNTSEKLNNKSGQIELKNSQSVIATARLTAQQSNKMLH